MKINASTMKMWSRIGSRAAYGMAALELGKKYDDLIILTGDTSTSAGLDRFKKSFPEKYLDVGIAEQNMIGIAAGLASEGQQVFTSTFSPFQTMRCCEQIRVNLGYMNHKVNMVGLASGLVLGMLGYTHCCIEDISIMRSIPGITVVSPADCGATVKAVLAAIEHEQSVYIRLTGGAPNPAVYLDDFDFTFGKANILKEGNDLAIIACGTMVNNALKTAELLKEGKLEAIVIDMHTIKPIDVNIIEEISKSHNLIVTVEEHSIIGGLGSAVSEYLSTLNQKPPLLSIGIADKYGKAGSYESLLKKRLLQPDQIANTIINRYYSL
jgi:transketolase